MKKAQVSQIFVFIISGIIIVAVLGFGVSSIFKLMGTVDEVQCMKFKEDLSAKLTKNKAYGSVDTSEIGVDCDYRQICFISDPAMDGWVKSSIENDYPIIQDSEDGNVKQNVFLINSISEDFYYIKDLKVSSPGYFCTDITGGRLGLHLEGKGSFVLLNVDKSGLLN